MKIKEVELNEILLAKTPREGALGLIQKFKESLERLRQIHSVRPGDLEAEELELTEQFVSVLKTQVSLDDSIFEIEEVRDLILTHEAKTKDPFILKFPNENRKAKYLFISAKVMDARDLEYLGAAFDLLSNKMCEEHVLLESEFIANKLKMGTQNETILARMLLEKIVNSLEFERILEAAEKTDDKDYLSRLRDISESN